MVPPIKLLVYNKEYFVWKPNICFIRVKNNYNLAAIENTTDLTMRKSDKVSHWGIQEIPRSECIIL